MPSKLPITIIIVILHPYVDILYHVVRYKILKPAKQRVLGLKGQYLKGKSKAKLKFPAQIREILHRECNKSMHAYSLEEHTVHCTNSEQKAMQIIWNLYEKGKALSTCSSSKIDLNNSLTSKESVSLLSTDINGCSPAIGSWSMSRGVHPCKNERRDCHSLSEALIN